MMPTCRRVILLAALVVWLLPLAHAQQAQGTTPSTFAMPVLIGMAPIATASWDAGGAKWTLPVGIPGGRLIKVGASCR
jgi:hypothetical protein